MACLLEVTLQFRESAEGPQSPWKLFGPNHAMGAVMVNTTIRIQTLAHTMHWQCSQPKAGSSVPTVLVEINTSPLHLPKYGVCVYLPPYAAPIQVNRSIWPVGAGFTCLPLSSKGCQSEFWSLPCGGRIHHMRNSPIQEGWPKTSHLMSALITHTGLTFLLYSNFFWLVISTSPSSYSYHFLFLYDPPSHVNSNLAMSILMPFLEFITAFPALLSLVEGLIISFWISNWPPFFPSHRL